MISSELIRIWITSDGKKFFNENEAVKHEESIQPKDCLLYTSPSPRDRQKSRMPSSA